MTPEQERREAVALNKYSNKPDRIIILRERAKELVSNLEAVFTEADEQPKLLNRMIKANVANPTTATATTSRVSLLTLNILTAF